MDKPKSTLEKVGAAIKDAVVTVAKAAEERVIEPVGHALGLVHDDSKLEIKPDPKRKARSPKRVAAKKPGAKKPNPRANTMAKVGAKRTTKATTKKEPAKTGRRKRG
jgi:hypothetical protein